MEAVSSGITRALSMSDGDDASSIIPLIYADTLLTPVHYTVSKNSNSVSMYPLQLDPRWFLSFQRSL
jgi:hypothetical protein